MADVKDRLAPLEGLEPPDLWDQVRKHRPASDPSDPPRRENRIAVISIALALAVASIGFVVIAFRSDPEVTPVTPGPGRVQNGDIWVKVGGGDGATAIVSVDPDRVRDSEWLWADQGGTFDATVAPELVSDDYAFSPDGTVVAFSAPTEVGGESSHELFVMKADGTGRRQLTNDGAYAGFPAWSPDGNSIAYASYRGSDYIPGCLGFSICPTDLYTVDATGGVPSPLVATTASETTPSWSPDGSRIAYAEIAEDGSGTIVTVRTDGSDRVELSPGGDVSFPSWSPDGKLILFLKTQDGTNHIWTVTPDGSSHHDVVDTRTDTNFGRPLWSPEGDAIAFARPYAGATALWITDPSGDQHPERIAGWPGFDGSPIAWQPVSRSGDVALLVSSSGPSSDDALLAGTLTTEAGCVAVSTGPASSVYIVGPDGYSLADEDGATWLIDDSGNRVAALGDQVQMGGGITNLAHAEPSVQGGIPASCQIGGPDAYWFAGTPELVGSSPTPTQGSDGAGSVQVQVPYLEGLSLSEARHVLSNVGLDVAPVYLANEVDEPGTVTSLEPDPGKLVGAATSVIAYVSAGPDGGGSAWAGSNVKAYPDVFIGNYRGSDSFPVLAVGPDANLQEWRAELEARSEGRRFELVRCPVEPETLKEVAREVRNLVEGGAIERGVAFAVDPRTCSVQVEGSFSPEELQLLRDQFGDLVSMVDGIKIAMTLGDR